MERSRCCLALYLLLLLIATNESKAQEEVLVNITTNSTTVIEGEDFTFQCVTQENVEEIDIVIDGSLGGEKSNRVQQDNIVSNITRFTFKNVTRNDQGTSLQCYAKYGMNSNKPPIASKPLSFDVQYKPIYTPPTSAFYTYNGTEHNKHYTLPLHSNPYPVDFVWSYNGVEITNATERSLTLSANSITFNTVLIIDNGTYTVEAYNFIGMDKALIELTVYYGPNFQQGDNITTWVEYMQGVNVSLTCSVTGSNPSNFTLNTTSTNSNWSNVILQTNDTSATFFFTSPDQSNNGFYNCTADNDVATTTFSYWVFFGDDPSGVKVCPSVEELSGALVITLMVIDTSGAPATALTSTVIAVGLEIEKTINFTQPILPMEAVVFPEVVSVPAGNVTAGMYTLEVSADNEFGTLDVLSTTFTYPLPSTPSTSCSFTTTLTTRTSFISTSTSTTTIISSTITTGTPIITSTSSITSSITTSSSTITSTSTITSSITTSSSTTTSTSTTTHASSGSVVSPSATSQPSHGPSLKIMIALTLCVLALILLVIMASLVIFIFWKKHKRAIGADSYLELVEEL